MISAPRIVVVSVVFFLTGLFYYSSANSADYTISAALVHESELARNEPDSQVHHLPRAYDDGLPSSAIRLRM